MTEFKIDFSELTERPQPEGCKGQIYRAAYDSWVGSDGDVNFRHRYRWIKSLSCEGCDQCFYLTDDINNFMDFDPSSIFECSDGFIHGELYQLKVLNAYRDWESGYVEDYDLGFVKYEEPEPIRD